MDDWLDILYKRRGAYGYFLSAKRPLCVRKDGVNIESFGPLALDYNRIMVINEYVIQLRSRIAFRPP